MDSLILYSNHLDGISSTQLIWFWLTAICLISPDLIKYRLFNYSLVNKNFSSVILVTFICQSAPKFVWCLIIVTSTTVKNFGKIQQCAKKQWACMSKFLVSKSNKNICHFTCFIKSALDPNIQSLLLCPSNRIKWATFQHCLAVQTSSHLNWFPQNRHVLL